MTVFKVVKRDSGEAKEREKEETETFATPWFKSVDSIFGRDKLGGHRWTARRKHGEATKTKIETGA